MQQEIRQRKSNAPIMTTTPSSSSRRTVALSAPQMLQASPQHYEFVMKLRISAFFSILPGFLQSLICRFSFLSFLAPSWERRFLILLGGYLYKFTNDADPTKEPKGSPLDISCVDINLLDADRVVPGHEDAALALSLLPPPGGCQGVFVVSTLRKKHYYATTTVQDAETWINSLRQAREEAIKRSMGHAAAESYPSQWTYYDRLGKSLADRKDRIRRRMQESRLQEIEMSNLTEGGAAPRGYYG